MNRRDVLKSLAAFVAAPLAFCTRRAQAQPEWSITQPAGQCFLPEEPPIEYVLDRIDATREPLLYFPGIFAGVTTPPWDGYLRISKYEFDEEGQRWLTKIEVGDEESRAETCHSFMARWGTVGWYDGDSGTGTVPVSVMPEALIPWIGPVAEGWQRDITLAENQSDDPYVNVYDYPQGRPRPPDMFPVHYRVALTSGHTHPRA